jgi:trimethylamine--corrinoid protein Co-methyltransferase
MDMQTGESLYSGVSKALASSAMNVLSAWQGLGVATGNYTTLCSNFGVQNGLEHAFGVFGTFFSPGNVWHGLGSLANACGMSPIQIVIDHDLSEMMERFRRGIDITDEKLATDSVVSVGPRGNFLADPLTLKYLRSDEHVFASCLERCAGGQDVKTMVQRAHERAEDLIASHVPAVPQDRVEQVRRYVERELANLKAGAADEE